MNIKTLTYTLLLFLIFTIGCAENTDQAAKEKDQIEDKEPEKAKIIVKELEKSTIDTSSLEYGGGIIHQKFWQDSNGENIVLLTKKDRELFVYHYAMDAGEKKLIRKIYDFAEENCPFDLIAEFIEESISVTDLDTDGLGEITFAYKVDCISDVSPVNLKLLILENGEKYIIRGGTTVDVGNEIIKGEKNIDPSFEKAPASFLKHANKVWEQSSTASLQ